MASGDATVVVADDAAVAIEDSELLESSQESKPSGVALTVGGSAACWVELAEENGEWHWLIWSKNGKPLATNAVPYKRKYEAVTSVRHLSEALAEVGGQPSCIVGVQSSDV